MDIGQIIHDKMAESGQNEGNKLQESLFVDCHPALINHEGNEGEPVALDRNGLSLQGENNKNTGIEDLEDRV